MVEFLVGRGANVNQTNNDGKSPLMYAAAKGSYNKNCVEK